MKIKRIEIGNIIGNKGVVKKFKLPVDCKIIRSVNIYAELDYSFSAVSITTQQIDLAKVSILFNNNTNQSIIDYMYNVFLVDVTAESRYSGNLQNVVPAKSYDKFMLPLNVLYQKNSFCTAIFKLNEVGIISSANFNLFINYD